MQTRTSLWDLTPKSAESAAVGKDLESPAINCAYMIPRTVAELGYLPQNAFYL